MDEKTWIVSKAKKEFLFPKDSNELWKEVLNQMGGEYKLILNAPLDPRLN